MSKKLFAALENLGECTEDTLCMNVPLFMRLLEFSREDAKSDEILHKLTENLTNVCKDGRVATMDDYDNIVAIGQVATESIKNDTESKVVVLMKDIDTANQLTKCLKEFFKKAAVGGDAEMLYSGSGDKPESCGTVGHDVRVEGVDHWISEEK